MKECPMKHLQLDAASKSASKRKGPIFSAWGLRHKGQQKQVAACTSQSKDRLQSEPGLQSHRLSLLLPFHLSYLNPFGLPFSARTPRCCGQNFRQSTEPEGWDVFRSVVVSCDDGTDP